MRNSARQQIDQVIPLFVSGYIHGVFCDPAYSDTPSCEKLHRQTCTAQPRRACLASFVASSFDTSNTSDSHFPEYNRGSVSADAKISRLSNQCCNGEFRLCPGHPARPRPMRTRRTSRPDGRRPGDGRARRETAARAAAAAPPGRPPTPQDAESAAAPEPTAEDAAPRPRRRRRPPRPRGNAARRRTSPRKRRRAEAPRRRGGRRRGHSEGAVR